MVYISLKEGKEESHNDDSRLSKGYLVVIQMSVGCHKDIRLS